MLETFAGIHVFYLRDVSHVDDLPLLSGEFNISCPSHPSLSNYTSFTWGFGLFINITYSPWTLGQYISRPLYE